jgi:beta-lactamase class A
VDTRWSGPRSSPERSHDWVGNVEIKLAALLVALMTTACSATPAGTTGPTATSQQHQSEPTTVEPLKALEAKYGARLGVFATNVATGRTVAYRQDERFAMLSTFKTYAAAALLKSHPLGSGYFDQVIHYTRADLVANSPDTGNRVATGMTVAELCLAAITKSDNTAGNLLLKQLGGPAEITKFARSVNDPVTRLDRWETELNSALRGDERDTTSPRAIGTSYQAFVLGDVLPEAERAQLKAWLLANTTGGARIRAGLPAGWTTGDKTGTGSFGSANDVAITWTDTGTPLVIAVLSDKQTQDATADNALIADAAKVVVEQLRSD